MADLLFPSQAWFDEYRERINADEGYADLAADWGVRFDGDLVFEMTDIPLEDLDEDALPADIRADLEEYVDAETGTGYALLGLEGGTCTGAALITDPDDVAYGFRMTGTFDAWKDLVTGDVGVVDGVMSGTFELQGDMQKLLQYAEAATRLTAIATEIDAGFVDERFA